MKTSSLLFENRKNTNSLKWDGVINDEILPMWVADMDFQCPKPILKELESMIAHGVIGYSVINQNYYTAIENWFNTRHQSTLKNENIIPVTGIIPALRAIIEELSVENDYIIIQPPVYYTIMDSIKDGNRRILCNPLLNDVSGRYTIDFEALEEIKKFQPKLFILCSPHNPVGRIWTRLEIERIGNFCIENKIFLVVDEIHCDLILPGNTFISFTSLSDKFLKNSIILTSPTKTFNFAGLRGGNVFIFNDALKNSLITRFNRQGINKLNSFYVSAATAGYLFCNEWLELLIQYIYKNYLYVKKFLKKEIPELLVTPAEATYLIWISYKKLNISEKIFITELNKRLIISEGSKFGENGNGYIRLNIACHFELIEKAMKILKDTVIKLSRKI